MQLCTRCTYQIVSCSSWKARRPTEKSSKTISHAAKMPPNFWAFLLIDRIGQRTTLDWTKNWMSETLGINHVTRQNTTSKFRGRFSRFFGENWQTVKLLMFFRTKKLSIICLSLNGHPSRGSCRNAVRLWRIQNNSNSSPPPKFFRVESMGN